jgi:dTDP-4-dehydrorhamnose reductase
MTAAPRTIVLGAAGQVGSALMAQLGDAGVGITRKDANITVRSELINALENAGPANALINAAAYIDVERAESERDLAFAVNADAAGWAAAWAADRKIPFAHYSTEYVFPDGNGKPWHERDQTAPLNAYGASKLAGETAVREANPHGLIIRTSWVYSEQANSFVRKVLQLAAANSALTMVADQWGSPTYAPALARATLRLTQDASLRSHIAGGVIHLASGRAVSRAEFARTIIAVGVAEGVLKRAIPVLDISSDAYASAAQRPLHCVLDCTQSEALGVHLGSWDDSLSIAVRAVRQ